jgi:general secretion pathway protein C
MTSRLLSFVIWAAVAASAAFWGLRLTARPLPVPAQAGVALPSVPQAADLSRLFGKPAPPPALAQAAPPPADSRFKLIGVVAPVAGQHAGLALIAVDGRAARPVPVGGRVDGDLVLRSVSHRRAELGPAAGGPATMVLELPAVPEAARGALPNAVPVEQAMVPVPPAALVPQPQPQPPSLPAMPRFPPPQVTPGQAAPPPPFGVTPAPNAHPETGAPTR